MIFLFSIIIQETIENRKSANLKIRIRNLQYIIFEETFTLHSTYFERCTKNENAKIAYIILL